MTCFTPRIVLTAVAWEARSRVDPAVDPVLREIVSPVRHGPLRRVLVLVARLEFLLVRMAIGAEGLHVADLAGRFLLDRVELVAGREVLRMVKRCAPVRVRSEEHTSELQSPTNLVCRLLLEK